MAGNKQNIAVTDYWQEFLLRDGYDTEGTLRAKFLAVTDSIVDNEDGTHTFNFSDGTDFILRSNEITDVQYDPSTGVVTVSHSNKTDDTFTLPFIQSGSVTDGVLTLTDQTGTDIVVTGDLTGPQGIQGPGRFTVYQVGDDSTTPNVPNPTQYTITEDFSSTNGLPAGWTITPDSPSPGQSTYAITVLYDAIDAVNGVVTLAWSNVFIAGSAGPSGPAGISITGATVPDSGDDEGKIVFTRNQGQPDIVTRVVAGVHNFQAVEAAGQTTLSWTEGDGTDDSYSFTVSGISQGDAITLYNTTVSYDQDHIVANVDSNGDLSLYRWGDATPASNVPLTDVRWRKLFDRFETIVTNPTVSQVITQPTGTQLELRGSLDIEDRDGDKAIDFSGTSGDWHWEHNGEIYGLVDKDQKKMYYDTTNTASSFPTTGRAGKEIAIKDDLAVLADEITAILIQRNSAGQTLEQWEEAGNSASTFVADSANSLTEVSLANNLNLLANDNYSKMIVATENGNNYHFDLLRFQAVNGRLVLQTDNLVTRLANIDTAVEAAAAAGGHDVIIGDTLGANETLTVPIDAWLILPNSSKHYLYYNHTGADFVITAPGTGYTLQQLAEFLDTNGTLTLINRDEPGGDSSFPTTNLRNGRIFYLEEHDTSGVNDDAPGWYVYRTAKAATGTIGTDYNSPVAADWYVAGATIEATRIYPSLGNTTAAVNPDTIEDIPHVEQFEVTPGIWTFDGVPYIYNGIAHDIDYTQDLWDGAPLAPGTTDTYRSGWETWDNFVARVEGGSVNAQATYTQAGVTVGVESAENRITFGDSEALASFIENVGFPLGNQSHTITAGQSFNIEIVNDDGTFSYSIGQVGTATNLLYDTNTDDHISFPLAAANFSVARTGTIRTNLTEAAVTDIVGGTNVTLGVSDGTLTINSSGGDGAAFNPTEYDPTQVYQTGALVTADGELFQCTATTTAQPGNSTIETEGDNWRSITETLASVDSVATFPLLTPENSIIRVGEIMCVINDPSPYNNGLYRVISHSASGTSVARVDELNHLHEIVEGIIQHSGSSASFEFPDDNPAFITGTLVDETKFTTVEGTKSTSIPSLDTVGPKFEPDNGRMTLIYSNLSDEQITQLEAAVGSDLAFRTTAGGIVTTGNVEDTDNAVPAQSTYHFLLKSVSYRLGTGRRQLNFVMRDLSQATDFVSAFSFEQNTGLTGNAGNLYIPTDGPLVTNLIDNISLVTIVAISGGGGTTLTTNEQLALTGLVDLPNNAFAQKNGTGIGGGTVVTGVALGSHIGEITVTTNNNGTTSTANIGVDHIIFSSDTAGWDGTGIPDDSIGMDGQLALSTVASAAYIKRSGSWSSYIFPSTSMATSLGDLQIVIDQALTDNALETVLEPDTAGLNMAIRANGNGNVIFEDVSTINNITFDAVTYTALLVGVGSSEITTTAAGYDTDGLSYENNSITYYRLFLADGTGEILTTNQNNTDAGDIVYSKTY